MSYSLSEYQQLASTAYRGTIFNYERAGKHTLEATESDLNSDVNYLRSLGISQHTIDRYVERFKRHFSAWIASESRCISSFITGPSNFPVRRANKARDAAHKRYDEFQAYRERVLTALERAARKAEKRELGITPLIEARRNLNARIQQQTMMKQTNATIRKHLRKSHDEQVAALLEIGHTPKAAFELLTPDRLHGIGFPSYMLTNNQAQIRRLKDRVEELLKKEYKAEKQEEGSLQTEFKFDGGYIELDYQADRLRIHHDSKPDQEIITKLKQSGFKWSPSNQAWQRQLTTNARWVAGRLTGVKC